MKVYISDVSGLINPPVNGEVFTTPEVVSELADEFRKSIVETRIEAGVVRVREPSRKFLSLAARKAKSTGDLSVLSAADISLLALALQFSSEGRELTVLTDDFALQNILKTLRMAVKPIFGKKVREVIVWRRICPVCRTEYPPEYRGSCRECGSALTRKAYYKSEISE